MFNYEKALNFIMNFTSVVVPLSAGWCTAPNDADADGRRSMIKLRETKFSHFPSHFVVMTAADAGWYLRQIVECPALKLTLND